MARDFELGSTEEISRATHLTGNVTNISFGGWFQLESSVTEQAIIFNGVGGGFGQGYALETSTTPRLRIHIPFVAFITSTTTLSTGVWYHGFVTRGASTWNIYVNGVSEATGTNNPFSLDSNSDTVIGARKNSSGAYDANFDGLMAEMAFWDRELSAGEVAGLAKGYSPLFYRRGLIMYKPLIRDTTELIDTGGTWVVDGTVAANHPRIIYPTGYQTARISAATTSTSVRDMIGGFIPFAR